MIFQKENLLTLQVQHSPSLPCASWFHHFDILPELLTSRQRTELSLGLRARLILELYQREAPADFEIIQPHLDRMQVLINAWLVEAGGTNVELPQSNFVDLVKNLQNDAEEREHFFQNVFPVEFGPAYDETLHTLMCLFLSRFEKILHLQSFQQVASMFGEASSALKDCMQLVSQCEELKTLLQYQKHLSQLDHIDSSLDGTKQKSEQHSASVDHFHLFSIKKLKW
ncbi:uncharacterized protein LOC102211439 isoform X3 [Pundamilia nyererei]|uniref:Uncharacterized protein LOC102211439 isoform X3 n=1 Tax=Pundamilia nyererei TaxID=303518 RepID=A0A9Y6M1C3_9CICH|nr:PREDICTED: uncharacterized protein LOC102211439 isoform X3 [Pundamilia nyererei]